MVQVSGHGPPEVVTGGSDGAVRVWDVRQPDSPVAAFPAEATGPDKVPIPWELPLLVTGLCNTTGS